MTASVPTFVSARWLVRLWVAGFLVSGLSAQGIGQRAFAASTVWGICGGWQREILVFNLFSAAMLVVIDRRSPDLVDHLVVPLTLLPLALGTNHLIAAVSAPTLEIGNWMGAISNGVAFLFGALVFTAGKMTLKD